MQRKNKVEVDREKLVKALAKRGQSLYTASGEIGHSNNYLNVVSKEGSIAMHAAKALEAIYNIKPEEYAPADATPANVVAQNEWARAFAILIKRTEPNELKELIKEAVREVLSE